MQAAVKRGRSHARGSHTAQFDPASQRTFPWSLHPCALRYQCTSPAQCKSGTCPHKLTCCDVQLQVPRAPGVFRGNGHLRYHTVLTYPIADCFLGDLLGHCRDASHACTLLGAALGVTPARALATAFGSLVAAVDHCHSQGVVHLDIKPDVRCHLNVCVREP